MAKEPNKSPDDNEKDDLFNEGLDEIDLDDLLVDDDTPIRKEDDTVAMSGKTGAPETPDIVEDGEIDLLAEDFEEPVEPVLAEDLIDLEEELPAESARQTTLDAGAGPRIESPSNGNPAGLDDDIEIVSETKEEEVTFDLLADDDVPLAEPAPSSVVPEDDPLPAATTSDDDLLGEAAGAAAAEAAPAGKKKLGKLKTGKPLKLGKTDKKGKKDKRAGKEEATEAEVEIETVEVKKEKVAKPKKERAPKERPVALPAGARGSITFVCSECYEEFLIPSSYSQEMVSCPECLHVGKRPDDEFLRTVHLHKSGEKRSFLSAVVVGALLFAIAIALMWMNTPYGAPQAGSDSTFSFALLGAAGLLTVILVWLVVRFEGNRWEVYF
jgi:hypothetical protein